MIERLLSIPISGEGTSILAVDVLWDAGHGFFVADCDIDVDGSGGNPEHDPYFQPDTTYHHLGKALNAYQVPFIVLPVAVMKAVAGIVLGCKARMTYRKTGLAVDCLVGDIGPTRKLGEASAAAARRVNMPPSPINGGADNYNDVLYEFWPGVPALIDGVKYKLQPLRRAAR